MGTISPVDHIAFIMDGNRRWARSRGLPAAAGHRKGAEVLSKTAVAAKNAGIRYMTVYAFSTENWGREKQEVDALMDLLRQYLADGFKELQKNDARIVFAGEEQMLPDDIRQQMHKIEKDTAENKSVTLCVALSYGGRQEIVHAAGILAEKIKRGELDKVNIENFSEALYTHGIPDPDLVVRTGGEKRISNFLLWQTAYSEFYFSDTMWPDFSEDELKHIIEDYSKRERRYGKS